MSPYSPEDLEKLVQAITTSPKYAQITPSLVERIAAEELEKRGDYKNALKAARTRLHQVTGAFLAPDINYAKWVDILKSIPPDNTQELQAFCQRVMRLHNSTAERLPYIEQFFRTALADISPVDSVLDLACGLNPLALPWMPLAAGCTYYACDVVLPMLAFLNQFFAASGIQGKAVPCDLSACIPQQKVQLAILLKTLPCLDQLDKSLGPRLLAELNADHILVSYPAKSLGGREKGMRRTYTQQFARLIEGTPFRVREFNFPNEMVFLLSR
ncbi:MAG: 16S rRNA methyltransferase [Chloroflexi bacterium]|nr:16S rRNA methyltransferase [Chloroflexota bacterium]